MDSRTNSKKMFLQSQLQFMRSRARLGSFYRRASAIGICYVTTGLVVPMIAVAAVGAGVPAPSKALQ